MVIIVAGLFVTDRVGSKSLCFCAAIVKAVNPPSPHPLHPNQPKKEKSLVLLTFIMLLFLNKQAILYLGCNTSALAAVLAVALSCAVDSLMTL